MPEKGDVMMFPPGFTRRPEFLAFKQAINKPDALECIFSVFEQFQVNKGADAYLPLKYFPHYMAAPVDASSLKDALTQNGFLQQVPEREDWYTSPIFDELNAALRASWANGKAGGQRKRAVQGEERKKGGVSTVSESTGTPAQYDDDVPF